MPFAATMIFAFSCLLNATLTTADCMRAGAEAVVAHANRSARKTPFFIWPSIAAAVAGRRCISGLPPCTPRDSRRVSCGQCMYTPLDVSLEHDPDADPSERGGGRAARSRARTEWCVPVGADPARDQGRVWRAGPLRAPALDRHRLRREPEWRGVGGVA